MSHENFRKISHPLFHHDHHIIYCHIAPRYIFLYNYCYHTWRNARQLGLYRWLRSNERFIVASCISWQT